MNDIIRIAGVMDKLGLFSQADMLFKTATNGAYQDDLSQLFPDPDEVARIMAKKSRGYYFINNPKKRMVYPRANLNKLVQQQSDHARGFYSLFVLHNGHIIEAGRGWHHADVIESMFEHYIDKDSKYNKVYSVDKIDRYHLIDKIFHGALRVFISPTDYGKYGMTITGYSYVTDAMIKSLKIIENHYKIQDVDVEFRYRDELGYLKNIGGDGLTVDSLMPTFNKFNNILRGFLSEVTEEKKQELDKLRQFLIHDFNSRGTKITPNIKQMLNHLKKSNLTQEDIESLVSTYSGKTKAEKNYYSKPGE